eukprot:TRINITY_DN31019_c0_g1_i1.p1 TRINITY_DN31019_c0_g1~~TRINITY_DN31019_c0_g1_i1.p1  ORF type:complete len:472 (-),score=85.85 TRINITY_DN31019_c0_g1_i1:548-1963(-)
MVGRVVLAAFAVPTTTAGVSAPTGQQERHCAGPERARCLRALSQVGFVNLDHQLGFLQSCGDVNPVMELLEQPQRLEAGSRPRWLLEDGRQHADGAVITATLDFLKTAFHSLRPFGEDLHHLAVELAHACLVGAEQRPLSCARAKIVVARELRDAHTQFLAEVGKLLQRAAALPALSSPEAWLAKLGGPAQIVQASALLGGQQHLQLWRSLAFSLEALSEGRAVTDLFTLQQRVGFVTCEVRAQLLAYISLLHLPKAPAHLPWSMGGRLADVLADLPGLELQFHQGAGAQRYNVLQFLVDEAYRRHAKEGRSLQQQPLRMVEVGVSNGATSSYLLERFPDLVYDGVDPHRGVDIVHEVAAERYARFGSRARLRRMRSTSAASTYDSRSLDIVFIDGDHSYPAVAADLRAWWPRVRPGGILAGHDLFNIQEDGVLLALLEHLTKASQRNGTAAASATFVLHFALDYTWWLRL